MDGKEDIKAESLAEKTDAKEKSQTSQDEQSTSPEEPIPTDLFGALYRLARKLPYSRIIIPIVLSIIGLLLFWQIIPIEFKNYVKNYKTKPVTNSYYPTAIISKQISILDLSEWTPPSEGVPENKVSKATWDTELKLKRVSDEGGLFAYRVGSSSDNITPVSTTHPNFKKVKAPNRAGGPNFNKYDLVFDIKKHLPQEEFMLKLSTSRYGGFMDVKSEKAYVAFRNPINNYQLIIKFPTEKIGSNFKVFKSYLVNNKTYTEIDISAYDINVDGNVFKWSLPRPELGDVYKITWDW